MIAHSIIIALLLGTTPVPDTMEVDVPPVRIGLALSGGAALGFAHIGVLKVLEQEHIPVCCIAGNSMGSLVGGIYAAGYSAAEIESIAVNADFSVLFSSLMPFGARYLPERQQDQRYIFKLEHNNFMPALPSGIVPLQNVEFLLMDILSDIEFNTYYEFDSLPIPYRTIAVDLRSGELITLKQGRLEQAIRASIAIPGVFSPETIDTLLLVDGGVQQFLPVDPLFEFHPDLIIASTTVHKNKRTDRAGLIDIISRTMDLINVCDYREQLSYADIVIEPDVDPFLASEFHRARELIDAGEKAAELAMPAIKELLREKKLQAHRNTVKDRPLPYIRNIVLQGLEVTRSSTLVGLIRSKPGMLLDFKRLHDDLRALYHTNLFEDVNFSVELIGTDSADIIIALTERKYGFYAAGIRYDNADKVVVGIEAGQSNLWGSGASIRAALNLGNPREIRIGLTGTRLFTFPFGYRLDTYRGSITRQYYESSDWLTDYTVIYHGALIEAGYILGHNAFFDIGLNVRQAVYRMPDVPVFDTLPSSEWMVGPAFRLEYNTYDDLHLPSQGTSFRITADHSSKRLWSTREFVRVEASAKRYMPVTDRLLFVPGLRVAFSWGDLTWDGRFLTGGVDLIGYEHGRFTTENRAILRAGIEYRIHNLLDRKDYPMYMQLMTNVASFEPFDELFRIDDLSTNLHWGAGVGFRTNTPIGPVHFTVGAGDINIHDISAANLNYTFSIGREFRY